MSVQSASEPSREAQGVLDALRALENAEARVKGWHEALCTMARELTEDEDIAWAYWHVEKVPVYELGANRDLPTAAIQAIAKRFPGWSWRCPACDRDIPIQSRSELKERRTKARRGQPPAPFDLCPRCLKLANERRTEAWRHEEALHAKRLEQLRTMPYRLYLQTDEWQATRRARLRAAQHRCQVCNAARKLHVHHRTYERRGNEWASDLIVLCDDCHAMYHRVGKFAPHAEEVTPV
jgi:hypothetical protein